MDQSKFYYPRGKALRSKEFSTFQRPKAHVVGALAHGRMILFGVSEPDLKKDANTHIDYIAHLLHRLHQRGMQLSDASVTLQVDNTSRECKNNVMLAFLTIMVSRGGWTNGRFSFVIFCFDCWPLHVIEKRILFL